MAGYARADGDSLIMRGLVGRPDGSEVLVDRASGPDGNPAQVGIALADALLRRGAGAILAASS